MNNQKPNEYFFILEFRLSYLIELLKLSRSFGKSSEKYFILEYKQNVHYGVVNQTILRFHYKIHFFDTRYYTVQSSRRTRFRQLGIRKYIEVVNHNDIIMFRAKRLKRYFKYNIIIKVTTSVLTFYLLYLSNYAEIVGVKNYHIMSRCSQASANEQMDVYCIVGLPNLL